MWTEKSPPPRGPPDPTTRPRGSAPAGPRDHLLSGPDHAARRERTRRAPGSPAQACLRVHHGLAGTSAQGLGMVLSCLVGSGCITILVTRG